MSGFRPAIGILTEGTSWDTFMPGLADSFRPRALFKLSAADLRNRARLRPLDLVIFPGEAREESDYPRKVDTEAMDVLRGELDRGLCLDLSCAAMFRFSASIDYSSPYKTVPTFPGLGVLPGRAWGTVDGLGGATRLIRVAFNDRAGVKRSAKILYHNGGAYDPAPGEALDVIARYAEAPGTPIAAGGKIVGSGLIVFSGPLPEIARDHLPVGSGPHKNWHSHYKKLRENIDEEGRAELQAVLVQRFQAHWSRTR